MHWTHNRLQGEGSLSQDEERIQQAERARNEVLAEAQFLQQALEEEKKRNVIAFQWVKSHHAVDMDKILALRSQLKLAKKFIDSSKNDIDISNQEVIIFQSIIITSQDIHGDYRYLASSHQVEGI